MPLKLKRVLAACDGERVAVRSPSLLRVIRGVLPVLRISLMSGIVISGFTFAFQAGPPNSGGGPQGPYTSSGAPANTAGPQGPFTSSGAPANTAGSQPVVTTGAAGGIDLLSQELETKLAGISEAASAENLKALRHYLEDTDAAVQSAAFDALSAKDRQSGGRDLLALISDTAQLSRGQALQLLANSPLVDDQTARAALRSALSDLDPLLRQYANEALALRDAKGEKPGNTPPNQGGGPQGAFASSGAPANTAGSQGAFASSGAPAYTAGAQPSVPTAVAGSFDPVLEETETKLAGITEAASAGNLKALRRYLEDTDAAVQSAAFDAFSAKDEQSAIRDLLAIIRDTTQLSRGQALQLLANAPQVDDQTVRAALRNALVDLDPQIRQYAIEARAVRDAGGQKP